jgi:hypothetical protein
VTLARVSSSGGGADPSDRVGGDCKDGGPSAIGRQGSLGVVTRRGTRNRPVRIYLRLRTLGLILCRLVHRAVRDVDRPPNTEAVIFMGLERGARHEVR